MNPAEEKEFDQSFERLSNLYENTKDSLNEIEVYTPKDQALISQAHEQVKQLRTLAAIYIRKAYGQI